MEQARSSRRQEAEAKHHRCLGRRENESNVEEATFARGSKRKPGRSVGSSRSKAEACSESALKGLVIVAGAGSSNASWRASLVGFSFSFKAKGGLSFFVLLYSVFSFSRRQERGDRQWK